MTEEQPDSMAILRDLYSGDVTRKVFLQTYELFFEQKRSEPVPSLPLINGLVVDLYELYHEVTAAGGFEKV